MGSSPEKVPFISLFSGAMGLDLGLEQAGFETRVAVEFDADAVKTIRHNRPTLPLVDRSIELTDGEELLRLSGLKRGEVPLVVGGPPCQAFSVIGKRRGLEDRRGQMVYEFVRIINETQPRSFVMENVRGMLSMSLRSTSDPAATKEEVAHGSLLRDVIQKFEAIGYRVDCFVVNAVNYGAPQQRERVILIGNREGKVANFPGPTHSNREPDGLPPFRTLEHAIGKDFVDPDPSLLNFSPRKLHYLAMVPEGGNWRSLPPEIQKESMGKSWGLKGGRSAYWRRLSFAFPSPTVVTMPNHASTSMCHPRETRAITVGEAAAIQEFPSSWSFRGTTQAKFRQVGNAVPVRLGEIVGKVVSQLLTAQAFDEVATPSRIIHIRPHVRTRSFWKNGVALSGDHDYYAGQLREDAS
ncbi:DNA cytosine methyltransferase [Microbacterium sp. K2]|uniref:DNA cytosine methyltransferase n=1 Tax=Microbacterium sp. K2 TaxID=3391827 RepID=UPI003ED90088